MLSRAQLYLPSFRRVSERAREAEGMLHKQFIARPVLGPSAIICDCT